jgi:hypothetical protein
LLKLRLTLPGIAEVEAWASFVVLNRESGAWLERNYIHDIVAMDVIGPDSVVKAFRGALLMHEEVKVEDERGDRLIVQVPPNDPATTRVARVGDLVHCLVTTKNLDDYFMVLDGQLEEEAYAAKLNETAAIPILPEWGHYLWHVNRYYQPVKLAVLGQLPKGAKALYRCPWGARNSAERYVSQGLADGAISLRVPSGPPTVDWNSIEGLDDYLKVFAPALASKVTKAHPPLHMPGSPRSPRIADLVRKPFEAQADVIQGVCEALSQKRTAFLIGEMGTGKTLIGAAVPYVMHKDDYRVLVMCPGHLVEKWAREIKITVPGAQTALVLSWEDMIRFTRSSGSKPRGRQYVVISKETMKLGARRRPAAIWRPPVIKKTGPHAGSTIRGGHWECPDCGTTLRDSEGIPLDSTGFSKPIASNQKCPDCGASLWSIDNSKVRKVAVVDLVKRLPKGYFDLLIADECHELKGESAQGMAFGAAAQRATKTLALTGTLMGGYASDLFYLLWRMDAEAMKEAGMEFDKRHAFVREYGVIERIVKEKNVENNWSSRGRKTTRDVERPGVSPRLFSNHILQTSAFLELSDLQANLPPYTEEVVGVDMDKDLAEAYGELERSLREAAKRCLQGGSKRLLGALLVNLLSYPDKPYENPPVVDPQDDRVVAVPRELPKDKIYPKEKALLDLIEAEVKAGRRVFVYAIYTASRDIAGRLQKIISDAGYTSSVLRASVKPLQREAWLSKAVQEGAQVVIANADLVKTGLDLLDFQTLVFYQTGYSIYTLRQASRRAWRIGQKYPVKVYFMAYHDTMQYKALTLIGSKLQASLMLEGKFSEDGLRALVEGTDMNVELARALAEGMGTQESAEEIWRKAYHNPAPAYVPPIVPAVKPAVTVTPWAAFAGKRKKVPENQLALFA